MVLAIFSTWGDISESVCGDLGKTGEWWEDCPCSNSSSGAPVEEIPLKMLITSIYCFERLPLASWGCRTCSSRRASWPAGSRGAPADCSPVCHLSSPRPTWSAQPQSRSTQLSLTTLTQPPNSKRQVLSTWFWSVWTFCSAIASWMPALLLPSVLSTCLKSERELTNMGANYKWNMLTFSSPPVGDSLDLYSTWEWRTDV